jgi:cell division protease FtsH
MNSNPLRSRNVWLLIGAVVLLAFVTTLIPQFGANDAQSITDSRTITIGKLADLIADPDTRQDIILIEVYADNRVRVSMRGGPVYYTEKDPNSSLPSQLRSMAIADSIIEDIRSRIEVQNGAQDRLVTVLANLLPLVIIGGLFFWLWRRGILNNPTKQVDVMKKTPVTEQKAFRLVTFEHIGGYEPAKQELRTLTTWLRDPAARQQRGVRMPSGLLLTGAPGTGKTRLAQAAAGETSLNLVYCNGSDFIEMFAGIGAYRIREVFGKARGAAPALLIFDNLDALGYTRHEKPRSGEDERYQTLAALLTELDNFTANQQMLIIGITNRPDLLDPALVRGGRFERTLHLEAPSLAEREHILRLLTAGRPLAVEVDLKALATQADGLYGADLERLVNDAALLTAQVKRDQMTGADFEAALSSLRMA